ncbi:UNVERIFIED_CONTAM: hypothetical protein GTU68_049756 [Idotea baltica]|nr:hypothetical protein [Idotea baltica]
MFGMEAAIYCPSGTMTNQIAIKAHTRPLDEVICDKTAHIYKYEVGGYAYHSGVSIQLLDGNNGVIPVDQVDAAIHEDFDWLPNSRLLCIENTANKGGGTIYSMDEMKALSELCKERGLAYHLDGARIFNAIVELKVDPKEIGALFDSISICFSKGLGAPVGSALLGSKKVIKPCRKIRKVMGGGMRQSGLLAAACIYALDHNVDRLTEDHANAQILAECLQALDYVTEIKPVRSNIIIFRLKDSLKGSVFIEKLRELDMLAIEFGPQWIRFVTHMEITAADITRCIKKLESIHS